MSFHAPLIINESDRLQILSRIRWWILGGQFAVLVTSYLLLDAVFPYPWLFLIILFGAFANAMSHILVQTKNAEPWHTPLFLIFDLLQWTAILSVTGGIYNPFLPFLLTPVVISGAYIATRRLILISVIMLACLTFLIIPSFKINVMQWYGNPAIFSLFDKLGLDKTYVSIFNHYIIFVIFSALLLVTFYMMRKHALKYFGAQTASNKAFEEFQQSNAIGTIATAVIHELGTPLNTIQLIASDLKSMQCEQCTNTNDIKVLVEQTERCRAILQEMTGISQTQKTQTLDALGLSMLIEKIGDRYRKEDIYYDVFLKQDEKGLAVINWSLEVAYVVRNVLQNAFQFAQSQVDVRILWECDKLEIIIEDDGSGFPKGIIEKIGSPYVSGRTKGDQKNHMGLGLFVAKNFIEQTDGAFSLQNKKEGGAIVVMSWRIGGGIYQRKEK